MHFIHHSRIKFHGLAEGLPNQRVHGLLLPLRGAVRPDGREGGREDATTDGKAALVEGLWRIG